MIVSIFQIALAFSVEPISYTVFSQQDKVMLKKGSDSEKLHGSKLEGKVTDENESSVRITVKDKSKEIPSKDVEEIIYHDAPEEFIEAMNKIRSGLYQQGLTFLVRAREDVRDNPDKYKNLRRWFSEYLDYYTGFCQKNIGKHADAMTKLDAFIRSNSSSRFLERATYLLLECAREKKNLGKIDEIWRTAKDPKLKMTAALASAYLLLENKSFDKAQSKFREIAYDKELDIKLKAEGRIGMLKCLLERRKDKDVPNEIKKVTKEILDDSAWPPQVKLFAEGLLAQLEFDQNDFLGCAKRLAKANVSSCKKDFNAPPVDEVLLITTEWIYRLQVLAYEELAKAADAKKEELTARRYRTMCATVLKEMLVTFDHGEYKREMERKFEDMYKKYLPTN